MHAANADTDAALPPAPPPPQAAAPAPPPPAPANSDEEAAVRFKRGLELFDEGDYKLALVEFERAYELAPNYRALYNIALVNIQLGRYAEAYRKFEAYLHDGGDGISPTRRAEVAHTLSDLQLRTATIDLSANVASVRLQLDGKPLTVPLPSSLLIDAGEHTVSASAPGYDRMEKNLTLAGTDRVAVRFNLLPIVRPATPATAPVETAGLEPARQHVFWPGVAATAALAAGAGVSFGVMLADRSTWNQLMNTSGSSLADRTAAANRVNTASLAADVLGGLAVVSGGITLYVSLRADHMTRTPSLAVTPSSVVLVGQF